jgi:hypothetical protein
MASTFSDLGIELMATGENAGTWGTKTNTNLQIVEKAIAGYVEQAVTSGGTTALTITDGDTTESTSVARHAVIKLTGTITGNSIVTVPDSIEKVYIVVNGTSGAYTVQFKTASGTGITFGASDKGTRLLFSDGTNIVDTATGGVGSYDLNGDSLILDEDQDTTITADTDDQIDIAIAGADDFRFTANTFTALSGSSVVIPDGGLTLGSTAVTSTAAELNILDGVTSTTAELNILDGVTSTATELNILDGDTSATSTTVADADRVVLNDGGTMKQVAVTDLSAYFDDEITAMPNLVTTGALNSGSISSGFGNIDIGSSNLTATGTISLGATSFNDNAITNVGDIALDSISADGTDINVAVSDNSATAFTIKQGSDAYLIVDTANSSESVSIGTGISGTAITLGHSTSEVTVADNLTVTGDLTVNGTTTTVNSTTVTIDDPIFTLGGDTAPGSDDNKDRGIEFRYHNGSAAKVGFFGFDDSASKFTFIADASNSSEVFSGSAGDVAFGEVAATSLDISGNADIDGTLETDALSIDSTTVTATAAELNLIDGGATVGTTAIADGDGIIHNDNGTMRVTTVQTFKTYFQSGASVAADDIATGDAAVTIATSAGDVTIDAQGSDTDIIFKGTDGGADTTFLTIDGSEAGAATFNNKIVATELDISGDIDVDGTTNLDVVDIDGAVDMASTLQVDGAITSSSGATITVSDNTAALELISTDADANVGPRLSLYRNSASPADNDILGDIRFMGEDDASAKLEYAKIEAQALDVSDGSIDTQLRFQIRHAGSGNDILKLTPTEVAFNDGSFDTDFRVESNNQANAFKIDAGNDTASFAVPVDIDSGVTIDNITIDGTEIDLSSGDLTLDVAGDIILDADGGDVFFKDDGTTFGSATNTSGNLIIKSGTTTALTFSGANATFAGTLATAAGGFDIAGLDIDGATDIGEAIVDADLFIVDNGAGGTNRKVAASRLVTYIDANSSAASVGKAIAMAIVFG